MRLLFVLFGTICWGGVAFGGHSCKPPDRVFYSVEIDGSVIETNAKFTFIANGEEIEVSAAGGSFDLPREVIAAEKFGVQVRCADFEIEFPEILPRQGGGTWIVQIDTPPFDKQNLALVKAEESQIAYIYAIQFHPIDGVSTGIISHHKKESTGDRQSVNAQSRSLE